jgi:hypothetical protein
MKCPVCGKETGLVEDQYVGTLWGTPFFAHRKCMEKAFAASGYVSADCGHCAESDSDGKPNNGACPQCIDDHKPLVKVTAGKPKLAFTFRSTMEAIAAVREYATNGPYKDPDNWKEVVDSDWDESLLRHVMAYIEAKRKKSSPYDTLSHLHHIAHVLTIAGFIVENHTNRDGLKVKEEGK